MIKPRTFFQLVAFVIMTSYVIGCSSGPAKESTGQYIDSAAITTKVKAAFVKDDELKAFSISVDTFKGVVQLSGFVDSELQVVRAGEVAQSVSGVQSVSNDLIVKQKIK